MAAVPVTFACVVYPEGHAYPGLKALLMIFVEFPGIQPVGKQCASQPTCFPSQPAPHRSNVELESRSTHCSVAQPVGAEKLVVRGPKSVVVVMARRHEAYQMVKEERVEEHEDIESRGTYDRK